MNEFWRKTLFLSSIGVALAGTLILGIILLLNIYIPTWALIIVILGFYGMLFSFGLVSLAKGLYTRLEEYSLGNQSQRTYDRLQRLNRVNGISINTGDVNQMWNLCRLTLNESYEDLAVKLKDDANPCVREELAEDLFLYVLSKSQFEEEYYDELEGSNYVIIFSAVPVKSKTGAWVGRIISNDFKNDTITMIQDEASLKWRSRLEDKSSEDLFKPEGVTIMMEKKI